MSSQNNQEEYSGIARVTVNSFVAELSELYAAAINGRWDLKMIPTPFLWGMPGVGKSAGIRQLAEQVSRKTGKKVIITEVRLLLFSPVDLRGVPVADADRNFTLWLKPKIFDMDPGEEVINILFLDELSAAPPAVQAAAYQITLDRRVGEHELPDNCIVIGAGNRTNDRSVAYRMPNALANRMLHYEVIPDFESWKEWAIMNRVHPYVLGYLSFDQSKFYDMQPKDDQTAFATPRSWMFVSNILNIMQSAGMTDVKPLYNQICGCIGRATGLSFLTWINSHSDLPEVESIFKGKKAQYPKTMDRLYALVMAMVSYVEHREFGTRQPVTAVELSNMISYASRFPADYQACLYSSLYKTASIRERIRMIPEFKSWLRKHDMSTMISVCLN